MRDYHPGYSLTAYGELLLNKPRAEAYVAAMKQVIKPGDVVLEIGAGPGIFAMLAARMGARKVIAVEPNPSIRLARRFVERNGLGNQVFCVEGVSTELTLDEPADVIISDLRSILPLYDRHIPSIIDARERLLAPGGALIGRVDRLFAAPIEDFVEYRRVNEPWSSNEFGLDLSAGAEFEANRLSKVHLQVDQLLAEEKCWWTLDYKTVSNPSAEAKLAWTFQRRGQVHAIALWFEAELVPGIGFSNHPCKPGLIYGQAFLPLPRGVNVRAGDQMAAKVKAHWLSEGYVWQWSGKIRDTDGALIDRFEQSSLGKRFSIPK